ncbi:nucleoside diphosphate-linked moiety X motif 19 [Periophthalmus magnuspinnatus]|uniref:nucleoside diphosphate-linked moiety X motif 19 n=1 Tax=Periophthalmus magnuspinnatus TaxID=409849 RepID=UPI00145B17D1|nr:nucleoside diphosphate-linked moiety X motif 19 [Periophthalmus magnuspinnatus]
MNHSLKHWKEAATLIVAAEQRLCAGSLASRTPQLGKLDTKHLPHSSCFDYNILLLKRSGKSGFMPNAYVFPGGLVDSSDFSSEWLDIFRSFSNTPCLGLRHVKQNAETRPPIFATDRLKLGSPIPGEVAFRICALRETFEESGVLLVVPKTEEKRVLNNKGGMIHHGINDICPEKLKKWRSLVNQSPSNFIRMCRELEVLPNIWALHEWSNWLTPEGRYGGRRFDTAFFICCLKEIPHTLQDQKEIELFQWSTPSEVLQSYEAEEVWIAPPQFYELSRLCRLPLLNDLHKFASERAIEGCEQWMPVITAEDDQHISLLPGDKLYPVNASESSTGHDGGSALHRMVISDLYNIRLQITIPPKYKHLLPVLPLSSKSLL